MSSTAADRMIVRMLYLTTRSSATVEDPFGIGSRTPVVQPGKGPVPKRRLPLLAGTIIAAALLLGACGESSSSAEPTTTSAPPVTPADQAALQSQLDELVDLGVPGAVLLVNDGDRSVTLTSGLMDLEAQTAMQPDARFRIASLTKPYVAAVVFQLAEEDKLSIDDTVEHWLPGTIANGDQITVRQLLDHSSGVADYFGDTVLAPYLEGDFAHVWSPQELIEIANDDGSQFAPGSEVGQYSNTNYALAGLIIEKVTGRSLREEIEGRIFVPLGLEHSTFATDATPDPTLARGYLLSDEPAWDVTELYPFYWGAGNIVSDIADAATFFHALLGGELVDDASLAAMKPTDRAPGAGLWPRTYSCGTTSGHDGTVPGFNVDAAVLENGREAMLFVNSMTADSKPAPDPAVGELWTSIMDAALCD